MAVWEDIASELRWACRSVEARATLLLGLCGALAASVLAAKIGLAPYVSKTLPSLCSLATALVFHQWIAFQLRLSAWVGRLEQRLGPGLGWGLLAASWSVPGGLRILARGKTQSREAFHAQVPLPASPAWPRSLSTCAWLVPLFLASCSAGAWQFSSATGLLSAAGALITGIESVKLRKAIRKI